MELKKNLFSIEDGVGVITMNYMKNFNAIDLDMADELLYLLDACENNPDVKVVVIKGTEKIFSAGGDIGYFYDLIQKGGKLDTMPIFEKVGALTLKVKKLSKLVVTSVSGAAAGAGANLAFSGDFIFAADNVKFIQAFKNIGLATDTGGAYLLSKAVGAQRALDMCLTARPVGAQEALLLGLVKEVCSKEELGEKTMAFAKELAKGPLMSYKNIKKQIFDAAYRDYEDFLKNSELVTQYECSQMEDFQEGVRAFIEKRKPSFTGKSGSDS